jgi:hypothetical protein
MRRALATLGLLLTAACGGAPELPPPVPLPTPRPAPPAAPAPAPDTCGARAHQHLVGRPRTEIPVPVDPSRQRVACTTCPVTLDHSPERLNFFFDAETGLVREVRCG